MEEDIKILEKAVKVLTGNDTGVSLDFERTAQAIENLIKGYRELEEENRIFALAGSNIALKIHVKKKYIPKSKIIEKIKKLAREFEFYAGREHFEWEDGEFDGDVCDDIALKIQVLKELMEDK